MNQVGQMKIGRRLWAVLQGRCEGVARSGAGTVAMKLNLGFFSRLRPGKRSRGEGFFKRLLHDEHGGYLVMMALMLPIVVGLSGLSTEGGFWLYKHRILQSIADNAAHSAANAYAADITSDLTVQAQAVAANDYAIAANGTTVTVNRPPIGACGAGTSRYIGNPAAIEVVVSENQSRLFSKMWFSGNVPICGRAVAVVSGGDCLLSLGNSGTGIGVSGFFVQVDLEGCSAFSNSAANNSISITGFLVQFTAEAIGAVGQFTQGGWILSHPVITTGDPQVADPYATLTSGWPTSCSNCSGTARPDPKTSCTTSPCNLLPGTYSAATLNANNRTYNFTAGNYSFPNGLTVSGNNITINMGAGNYSFGTYSASTATGLTISGNSVTMNLGAGVYYVNQAFSINGTASGFTLNGTSVTLVTLKGITFPNVNLGTNMTLTAPTSGTTAGIVIWEPAAYNSTVNFFDLGLQADITGVVYAPNASFQYKGIFGSINQCTQVVAKSITIAGAAMRMKTSGCNYGPGFKSFGQLVALVE